MLAMGTSVSWRQNETSNMYTVWKFMLFLSRAIVLSNYTAE